MKSNRVWRWVYLQMVIVLHSIYNWSSGIIAEPYAMFPQIVLRG
jgi:hypothetical protein